MFIEEGKWKIDITVERNLGYDGFLSRGHQIKLIQIPSDIWYDYLSSIRYRQSFSIFVSEVFQLSKRDWIWKKKMFALFYSHWKARKKKKKKWWKWREGKVENAFEYETYFKSSIRSCGKDFYSSTLFQFFSDLSSSHVSSFATDILMNFSFPSSHYLQTPSTWFQMFSSFQSWKVSSIFQQKFHFVACKLFPEQFFFLQLQSRTLLKKKKIYNFYSFSLKQIWLAKCCDIYSYILYITLWL